MELLNGALSLLTAATFTVLSAMALAKAASTGAPNASRWLAAAFTGIALVAVVDLLHGDDTSAHGVGLAVVKLELVLLALFPFLLYRFAACFGGMRAALRRVVDTFTALIVTWTLLLQHSPESDEPLTTGFLAYTIVFIFHFTFVTTVVAMTLWQGGRGKPHAVCQRMRTMSIGAISMAATLLLSGAGGNDVVNLAAAMLALLSGVTFYLGYAPPPWLRVIWRRRDSEEYQLAVAGLVTATDMADVTQLLLPRVAAMIGATSAAFLLPDGTPLASWQMGAEHLDALAAKLPDHADFDAGSRHMPIELPETMVHRHRGGWLVVGVDSYTPFFGREETYLLDTVLTLFDMAVERVTATEREREVVRRLRELDQMKTEFVAMVAHDLRSPMSVISGFADTLRVHGENLTNEQRSEYLAMISDTVHTLAVLVEDVLQVARIESGEYTYEISEFDMHALAQRAVTEQRALHPERTIELAGDASVMAVGDRERVLQVLTNFITNAIKFSPPDGTVLVSVGRRDGEASVLVQDQGMGIRPEDMERLFQKFSRISPAAGGPKIKGTGLGLYICRSIIEALDGDIWATSTPGEGSTFAFSLPISVREESMT